MKILILSNRIPFPQNGGYPIVVYNTIKGLVDQGHEISLLALNASDHKVASHQIMDSLLEKITYQSYDIDVSVSFFDAFVNLFSRKSDNVSRFYDIGFEKLLITELKRQVYDIVQFEGLFMSPYLNAVRKYSKAKVIYRAHNIEHLVWQRLAKQKNDPIKKIYLQLLARRLKSYEVQQFDRFDAIVAITGQDRQSMLDHATKVPIGILSVGINLERYKPDFLKTEFPSLFFLGSLDWLPNREGLLWFLDNFYNDITEGDLKVKFYVAGHAIPEELDEYEVMGKIYISGEVDDALEFVNSKSIMVVPLLSGGGMRVKIIEGMALQKCIISTTLGLEGIHCVNGENVLIANNRDEFKRAIKRCITDEKFCRAIGINARQLVEKDHDINVITLQLIDFYQQRLAD
ncbi:MAG: glycosyltransferase family 4 protein [Sphingobacteriaceae bacterium]